jgi:hypothetical protein
VADERKEVDPVAPPEPVDRRTLPKWAWWPATSFLIVLSVYFLSCFHWVLHDNRPAWTTLGGWSMFSGRATRHTQVDAFAEIDGTWIRADLPALFPTRWDSGYRWERGPFRRSKLRMGTLGASLCRRHPDGPTRVRFDEVRWKRVLGTLDQPRKNAKSKTLLEWSCDERFNLPRGRSL